MNYVDGNLVRGNYKSPTFYTQSPKKDKLSGYAPTAGYAVGLANTLREMYPVIQPVIEGAGKVF